MRVGIIVLLCHVIGFSLVSCGGGGGSGGNSSDPVPFTIKDPGRYDGWYGQIEFTQELNENPGTGTDITVMVSDVFSPNINHPTAEDGFGAFHGEKTFQIAMRYAAGPVLMSDDPLYVQTIETYTNLDENSILSYSIGPCWQNTNPWCFRQALLTSEGTALVAPTGNLNITMDARPSQDEFNRVSVPGLVIWVGGLDATRQARHPGARPCDLVMMYCIVAPYEVQYQDPGGSTFRTVSGTSYSVPQVAGALSMVRTRWPRLDNKMAIALLLTTAQDLGPDGVDAETGWGALDFRALFSPVGDLNLPVGFGSGTLSSLRAGKLFLPGLVSSPALNGYDSFDRDFPLVKATGSIKLVGNFESYDWAGEHWVASAKGGPAIGIRTGPTSVLFINSAREVGFATHSRSIETAVSVARSARFFGGYGTGSLAFGETKYLSAQAHKKLELDPYALTVGLRHTCGRAQDGVLVRDLDGCASSLSANLTQTIGLRSRWEFGITQDIFAGDFRLAGELHRLSSEQLLVGFNFQMQF